MQKYSWRNTSYPVKAETAAAELQRIEQEHGEVTPRILLDESTPEDAVMHPCYEWDDEKAADKYRLWQSRNILSCLTITYVDVERPEAKQIEVRAYQNVSDERNGRFLNVQTAMAQTSTRETVLMNALKELAMFRKKYADLSELSKVISVIDEIIEGVN